MLIVQINIHTDSSDNLSLAKLVNNLVSYCFLFINYDTNISNVQEFDCFFLTVTFKILLLVEVIFLYSLES